MHISHSKDQDSALNSMAISATLHCLTGCSIGEVIGLIVGTIFNFSTFVTVIGAVLLSFVFGFGLSTIPLLKSGLGFVSALSIVFAADTLSIATMEVVDNAVMAVIPGAMSATLVNPVFWITMPLSLTVAFFAALPVNKYLLKRNKGHALTMQYHEGHH